MERCCNCVLPQNYPNINFNTKGVCNFCLEYQSPYYAGEEKFNNLISSAKKKRISYDCLVPWSGGRDSTFVLYKMVKKYNAKVLAYNYDNGFTSPRAKENIERIATLLNVDLISEKMPHNLHRKYLKELILLNIDKSLEHVLFSLCSICRFGIWGGAYKIAMQKDIPLIVFGESKMESGYAKKVFVEKIKASKLRKIMDIIRKPSNFLKRKWYSYMFIKYFHFPFENKEKKFLEINFYDYLQWDEEKMLHEIEQELGWQYEKSQDVWRFDCMIHDLVNYLNYSIYGFSEKEELLSKMINEKIISREYALQRIQRSEEKINLEKKNIREVFERLQLDKKTIKAIMRENI